jgi:GH24 family phage-related lysozyme (muramidase)
MSQQKRVSSKDFKPTPNNLEMVRKYTPFTLSPKLNRLRVPSIGWGTTIYPSGDPVLLTDPPIAIEMAEELLKSDCQNALIAIRFLIDVELEENQIDALISLVNDIGVGGFGATDRGFKGSLLRRAINSNAPIETIKPQWLRWSDRGNNPSSERRNAELRLWQGLEPMTFLNPNRPDQ